MKKNSIYAVTAFIFITFWLRLIDVQLLQGDTFAQFANNNRTFSVEQPEERGVFLDRYGDPLVYNSPIYYKLDSNETLYSERKRITRDEALESLSQDADSVQIEYERMYLYPQALAPTLGYIGAVTVDDLLTDTSLHISDKIGKMGLELQFQSLLRGVKGAKKYEINALGEKQKLLAEDEGRVGNTLSTSIDPYLSQIAFEAMGEAKGAVVIMDADTGEVLSLVSTPTFDVNYLSQSKTNQEEEQSRVDMVRSFFSHPQKLFFNRAVSGQYPPGSVFKVITSLAGLEDKKITSDTTVDDEGVLVVGEYKYANWYFTQFGRTEGLISLVKAIARSNDTYFYKVAEWVGPEKIKEMSLLFGLGKKTNIELQSETMGLIPDPEWKQLAIGERWFLGNTYHLGIGQGDLLVSPIQVAQMIQAIANEGTLCQPSLVSTNIGDGGVLAEKELAQKKNCKEVGVLPENLELVVRGMLDACSVGGTGFPFFIHNSQYRHAELDAFSQIEQGAVACKTGTSEFGGTDSRGYRKTHGWFVAIIGTQPLIDAESKVEETATISADLKNQTLKQAWRQKVKAAGFPKKLVVVALVESDELNPYKEGSKDAGPVVKKIFDWMFTKEAIFKDLNQVPDSLPVPEYALE